MRLLETLGARWLGARAECERRRGRYEVAERLFRQALDRLPAQPRDSRLLIALLNGLGITCKGLHRFEDARAVYRRALRIARIQLPATHVAWPALYHNLGGLEHARGRYRRAAVLARHGLRLRQRCHGSEQPEVACDLAALGAILDGLARHLEAERLHRRALAILERRHRSGHPDTASALANLAACLHRAGRADEAVPHAQRAIAMYARLLGESHPETVLARDNFEVVRRS